MIFYPLYRYLLLTLITGTILFLTNNPLPQNCFSQASDEGYYYKYASLVSDKGMPAFKDLINWYASSDEARLHPAPVRAGYVLLCAFLFKLSHPSVYVLVFISTLSFFIFLYVSFYYVRKYFNLDTALLTTLFLVSSPLMMGLSRRALVDSPVNLLWGLTVWLFLDVLLKPKRFSYICFLMSFFASISFKEASLILIPFFAATALVSRMNGGQVKISQIWGIVVYPLLFILIFYGWVYGGIDALKTAVMAVVKTHFSGQFANSYAVDLCSGPWFRYLLDFLLLTPIVTVLFIGYAGHLCLQRKEWDFKRIYLLFYFVYVYAVLNSLAHSKVVRYVVNLEMVMALFAVLMLLEAFKDMRETAKGGLVLFLAIGIFVYNWFSFVELIYVPSLLDPVSTYFLVFRHLVPV